MTRCSSAAPADRRPRQQRGIGVAAGGAGVHAGGQRAQAFAGIGDRLDALDRLGGRAALHSSRVAATSWLGWRVPVEAALRRVQPARGGSTATAASRRSRGPRAPPRSRRSRERHCPYATVWLVAWIVEPSRTQRSQPMTKFLSHSLRALIAGALAATALSTAASAQARSPIRDCGDLPGGAGSAYASRADVCSSARAVARIVPSKKACGAGKSCRVRGFTCLIGQAARSCTSRTARTPARRTSSASSTARDAVLRTIGLVRADPSRARRRCPGSGSSGVASRSCSPRGAQGAHGHPRPEERSAPWRCGGFGAGRRPATAAAPRPPPRAPTARPTRTSRRRSRR